MTTQNKENQPIFVQLKMDRKLKLANVLDKVDSVSLSYPKIVNDSLRRQFKIEVI